jgi:hypothetical protein
MEIYGVNHPMSRCRMLVSYRCPGVKMRIDFESEGYVEITRSNKPDQVCITVASRKPDNPLEVIANVAEIPKKKLVEAYHEVIGPQMLENQGNAPSGQEE